MSNPPAKLSFSFKAPTGTGSLSGGGAGFKVASSPSLSGSKADGRGVVSSAFSGSTTSSAPGKAAKRSKAKAKTGGTSAFSGFGDDEDEEEHDLGSTPGAGPSNPKPKSTGMISKPPSKNSSGRVPPSFSSSSSNKASIYDDPEPSAPTSSASTSSSTHTSSHLALASQTLSRQARKAQQEALAIDSSVFEYDEVWDGIKEARDRGKEEAEREGLERKPKYIESFLASAQTRRLDRIRAEDKMTQLARDKEAEENPELGEKDSFVTPGYKKQMEEVKREEEKEREREEKDRLSKKGPGMTTFYSNMLAQSEAEHAAAVKGGTASAVNSTTPAGPSLAIRPPTSQPASTTQSSAKPKTAAQASQQHDYDPDPEADSWLLREAAAKRQAELLAAASTTAPVVEKLPGGASTEGEKVEINDEGAIVDKRVLLKAGLNITKKPIAGLTSLEVRAKAEAETRYQSRAVGSSASYAERNARERERLTKMIAEEEEREKKRKEVEVKEAEQRALKRKQGGDEREEGDLKRKAAKERFEERKRRKKEEDEEAARVAALGDGPAD